MQKRGVPALAGELDIAADIGADLGEGPIWDDETDTLLCVDTTIGRIYRFDPATGKLTTVAGVGQEIGVAIPRRAGGLVVSARDGLLAIDATGATKLLAPVEPDRETRMNDAKCDTRGRLWSGTFALDFARKQGALYRIDADLTVHRVHAPVSVSNGLGWSPDETRLYYVDTVSRGIDMFDFDSKTGAITNFRQFVAIDRADGIPDGLAVDAQGCVWVALYLGGAVRRYAPDGQLLGEIALPMARITSCGFGGRRLDELYITTANQAIVDDGHPHEPQAGALYRFRAGVRGLPTNRFAG